MPKNASNLADTPRNLIDKHLGRDALILLDSLGIGVFWRDELNKRQKLMSLLLRLVKKRSAYLCPLAQIAGVVGKTPLIPLPAACAATGHIIRRGFCGGIVSEAVAVHKEIPAPTPVRRNRKRANVRFAGKAHRKLRGA